MSKLRVSCFSLSLDGYGAGPAQGIDHPLGVGGTKLHGWMTGTRTFHTMIGKEGGQTGMDDQLTARGMENVGAWILGRNMFGPVRGPWPDAEWRGWWGSNPPYHVPVFVLTHYPRPSIRMEGGTVFHFITEGIATALARAREAAGGRDVRLGGGVATIRQFLAKGWVDELHFAISPVLLGSGESLFQGMDLLKLGYECVERVTTPQALHVVLKK